MFTLAIRRAESKDARAVPNEGRPGRTKVASNDVDKVTEAVSHDCVRGVEIAEQCGN